MDHLLEHEGEPIPDPSAAASATQPPIAPNQDDGDDEDTEALRHLESAGEAKVLAFPCHAGILLTCSPTHKLILVMR